jgi:hypothetical protein
MTDFVDSGHEDRFCPYCGRQQRWVAADPEIRLEAHYFHIDNLNQHCDEERLALWDMNESWKKTPPQQSST